MSYSTRHFRQTHASYQCAKRKQKRTSVDIAIGTENIAYIIPLSLLSISVLISYGMES